MFSSALKIVSEVCPPLIFGSLVQKTYAIFCAKSNKLENNDSDKETPVTKSIKKGSKCKKVESDDTDDEVTRSSAAKGGTTKKKHKNGKSQGWNDNYKEPKVNTLDNVESYSETLVVKPPRKQKKNVKAAVISEDEMDLESDSEPVKPVKKQKKKGKIESKSDSELKTEDEKLLSKIENKQMVGLIKMQRPLFTLPLPGVLVNALMKFGFINVEDIFVETGEFSKKAGEIFSSHRYSLDDLKHIIKSPLKTSANQLLKAEATRDAILTFSQAIDNAIGGGIQTETITQLCGPPCSGKTQIVLQLCVNVQIPSCLGGLGGEAVFIDTDSGFSVKRFEEISIGVLTHCMKVAQIHNLVESISDFSFDSMLNHLHYLEVGNYIELIAAVHSLHQLILKHNKIKIIVIDSFVYPFLSVTNLLERTRAISMIVNNLQSLAVHFNLAVVITNHVTTKLTSVTKSLVPSLGESLSHSIPQIIFLGAVGNRFSASIYKSNAQPESVVQFMITQDGIRDHIVPEAVES